MSVNSLFKPNDYTVYAGEFIGPIMGPIDIGAIAYSGVNPVDSSQLVIKALSTTTAGTGPLLEVDADGFTFASVDGDPINGNAIAVGSGGMIFTNETTGNIVIGTADGDVEISSADGQIRILTDALNATTIDGNLILSNIPDDDGTTTYTLRMDNNGKLFKAPVIAFNVSVTPARTIVGGAVKHILEPLTAGGSGQFISGGLLQDNGDDGIVTPPITGTYFIGAVINLAAGTIGDNITAYFVNITDNVEMSDDTVTLTDNGSGEGIGVINFELIEFLYSTKTYGYYVFSPTNNVTVTSYPTTILSATRIV